MAKLTGLAHIGVCVSNMDRSVAFYQDVLGLALESASPWPMAQNSLFCAWTIAPLN